MILVLLQAPLVFAAAEEPGPDEDLNWVEGTLQRFFGSTPVSDDNLEGEGLELVGPYVEFEGKTIEVVIVRQVRSFETGWDDNRIGAERILNSFSSRFQDYTKEKIIRQYLLFRAGDTLVPFDLADTEEMLRNLSYINDVRIHVVPLEGETDKVGIVVETNDRWPFGISGTIITADKWVAKIYSSNVGGQGILFSNEILRNRISEKGWGYHGVLSKENIGGSFWNGRVGYENSYRKKEVLVGVDRPLIHPGVIYTGGAQWQYLEEFDNDKSRSAFKQGDFWGGKVIRLYDRKTIGGQARTVLVPAVRVVKRDYEKRPTAFPDSNRGYHNYTQYLTSLTWQRSITYKTSHLFGEGEVEDLPTGVSAKVTAGLEDREFETRPGLFFDSVALSMRNRGDVAHASFSLGGYLYNDRISDGVLNISTNYYTQLFGEGSIKHRFNGGLKYTLGIGRHPGDRIYLSDSSGVYGLGDKKVAGNQRLVLNTFYRMFTRWSILGFRMSLFSFADLGIMGDEVDSLFKNKLYLSTGLGVRLRNPFLVLPTVQLRMSLISNIENRGLSFGVKVGNAPGQRMIAPSTKPGTIAYK